MYPNADRVARRKPRKTPGTGRVAETYVAFGAVLVVAHAMKWGPLQAVMVVLLALSALVVTVLAALWYKPRVSWPWFAVAGAFVVTVN